MSGLSYLYHRVAGVHLRFHKTPGKILKIIMDLVRWASTSGGHFSNLYRREILVERRILFCVRLVSVDIYVKVVFLTSDDCLAEVPSSKVFAFQHYGIVKSVAFNR